VAALRGEDAAVEPGFAAALQGFRQVGMPFEIAVTLLELAEWLAAQSRHGEAEPALTEAREILERLKARPWLERLARVSELMPTLAEV
jgi:hypothetical protein